ncbi:helix-turn-helix transcriptional regulator [Halomonas sp. SL1]|uniref:helix-turn-helix domain-containing protein n=1 Tax=Halomonas sp. SL1 TaxID=2137478 RepID=UPI0015ECA0A4|nr:helix-turn-helix transcriptional regulator [Halomonas sp. SL1]
MSNELAANLSLLCSHYPSIADVCRRLGINRQQFNKYLNGSSRPSRHNMRRISDFFGVTEAEIMLESSQFELLLNVRRRPVQDQAISLPLQHLDELYRHSQSLERYVGYYYRYFFSFGHAGLVIRSLATIYERDGHYYWKNIEVLRDLDSGRTYTVNKYEGVVFFLADRIYIMECEALQKMSLTQLTLYPNYHLRVRRMRGIQTGGPVRRGRRPGASKVLLEYLGREVDTREALRRSGLFTPDSPELPDQVVEQIRNTIGAGQYVLEVEEP